MRKLQPDQPIKLVKDSKIRRVVLCSGKVYYDLYEEREKRGINDIYLLRVEQLYPFPAKALITELSRFRNAEMAWCQEEPKNMGAWSFIDPYLEWVLAHIDAKHQRVRYTGRPASASPATGMMSKHLAQLAGVPRRRARRIEAKGTDSTNGNRNPRSDPRQIRHRGDHRQMVQEGQGDAVAVDEPLVELETDKVTVEVPSPAAGVLAEIAAKEGETVGVGALLGAIDAGGGAKPAKKARGSAPPSPKRLRRQQGRLAASTVKEAAAKTAKVAGEAAGRGAQDAAGAGRRKAARREQHRGRSGAGFGQARPGAEGRRSRRHRQRARRRSRPRRPRLSWRRAPSGAGDEAREERVRMTKLRQTIARRLKEAQSTAAMLTTFNEVDMSGVMEHPREVQGRVREEARREARLHGLLHQGGDARAEGNPVGQRRDRRRPTSSSRTTPISASPSAPTRAWSCRSCAMPTRCRSPRSRRRSAGWGSPRATASSSVADMQGGTFTISNGGVYGSLMSTPILNAPQSGILGMHKIQERPVVVGGQIVIRPMMYLALSYDHRIVDGKEAVTFLVRVKESLEDPERLVLDL